MELFPVCTAWAARATDFNPELDRLADLHHFRVPRELGDAALGRNMHLLTNLFGLLGPDPVNVPKRDDDALVGRNIDTGYASHSLMLHVGGASA